MAVRRDAAQSAWFAVVRASGVYLLLLGASALFAVPVLWMFSSSLQDLAGVYRQPFAWVPSVAHWENYARAVTLLPFARFLANTAFITVLNVLFTVASCTLVAYGFARFSFPGRDLLFSICLGTMMLPGHVTMIPMYIVYAKLGWVDSFAPLIVPSLFGSPFSIFLLRQFFLTIPRDCDEAALLDGAGRLRVLWSVILPQAKPALATVVIFAFIGSWNDFFGPLVYINSPERATLTLGLNMLKSQVLGSGTVEWNVLMAASLLVLLPNIVLFFFAQKHFLRGMNIGAYRI